MPRPLRLLALLSSAIASSLHAAEPAPAPAAFCRYVPERAGDFAWENDRVAFRTYGPGIVKGSENSGIDCWAKRVPYPVIDKWYRLDLQEKQSYHQDRGEGLDFYHVGKSRGCGGTALWHEGKMVLSGVFREWKIIESSPKKSVFQLTYGYTLGTRRIQETKTITLALGQRLFKSESVFTEDGHPADLEIAVGVSTHNQKGAVTMNREAGWIAVWRVFGKHGFGTGVVMDPARVTGMAEIKSEKPDESHVILTCRADAEGRTVHYAGFAWAGDGDLVAPEQWHRHLSSLLSR